MIYIYKQYKIHFSCLAFCIIIYFVISSIFSPCHANTEPISLEINSDNVQNINYTYNVIDNSSFSKLIVGNDNIRATDDNVRDYIFNNLYSNEIIDQHYGILSYNSNYAIYTIQYSLNRDFDPTSPITIIVNIYNISQSRLMLYSEFNFSLEVPARIINTIGINIGKHELPAIFMVDMRGDARCILLEPIIDDYNCTFDDLRNYEIINQYVAPKINANNNNTIFYLNNSKYVNINHSLALMGEYIDIPSIESDNALFRIPRDELLSYRYKYNSDKNTYYKKLGIFCFNYDNIGILKSNTYFVSPPEGLMIDDDLMPLSACTLDDGRAIFATTWYSPYIVNNEYSTKIMFLNRDYNDNHVLNDMNWHKYFSSNTMILSMTAYHNKLFIATIERTDSKYVSLLHVYVTSNIIDDAGIYEYQNLHFTELFETKLLDDLYYPLLFDIQTTDDNIFVTYNSSNGTHTLHTLIFKNGITVDNHFIDCSYKPSDWLYPYPENAIITIIDDKLTILCDGFMMLGTERSLGLPVQMVLTCPISLQD